MDFEHPLCVCVLLFFAKGTNQDSACVYQVLFWCMLAIRFTGRRVDKETLPTIESYIDNALSISMV